MLAMCRSTVRTLSTSCSPISRPLLPEPRRRRTSTSRVERTGRAQRSQPEVYGAPVENGLLFLHRRPRLRSGLHQALLLLPLPGQGLAQRPRVGQAPGRGGGPRLHGAGQRLRGLRRPDRLQAICDRLGPADPWSQASPWRRRLRVRAVPQRHLRVASTGPSRAGAGSRPRARAGSRAGARPARRAAC